MRRNRDFLWFAAGICLLAVLFFLILNTGAIEIPFSDIMSILAGGEVENSIFETIILETRLPMAIASCCAGVMLSVAGLLMQTFFHNPLAGPSVLGISAGSSLGVALLMLGAGGAIGAVAGSQPIVPLAGSLIGGLVAIFILYILSSVLKSGITLLIAGVMLGYLCSSFITLLNFFSKADEIRNYLVWGMGSFNGIRFSSSLWFLVIAALCTVPTVLLAKPLNALLMGENYTRSIGFDIRRLRGQILIVTGVLVAVPTAFCGPIGFIGLIVPHLCRLLFKSSNHIVLIPGCMIFGGVVSMFCAFLGVVPSAQYGVLPVNIITPIIGVPVILYLLINRNKLPYFA